MTEIHQGFQERAARYVKRTRRAARIMVSRGAAPAAGER